MLLLFPHLLSSWQDHSLFLPSFISYLQLFYSWIPSQSVSFIIKSMDQYNKLFTCSNKIALIKVKYKYKYRYKYRLSKKSKKYQMNFHLHCFRFNETLTIHPLNQLLLRPITLFLLKYFFLLFSVTNIIVSNNDLQCIFYFFCLGVHWNVDTEYNSNLRHCFFRDILKKIALKSFVIIKKKKNHNN